VCSTAELNHTESDPVEENGYNVVYCSTCGAKLSEEPVITGTIAKYGNTLALEGMVYINHYVTMTGFEGLDKAYVEENGGLLVWKTSVTEEEAVYGFGTPDINELTPVVDSNGNVLRYLGATDGIAMSEYADELYFRVYLELPDGSYAYGPLQAYSVQAYCESRLKSSSDAKLVNLCAAMLHFGAQAQVNFNHNTGDLANANILETHPAEAFDSSLLTAVEAVNTNIVASGNITNKKTLSLDGMIRVNYYFTPTGIDVANAELMFWEGVAGELSEENVSYTVELANTPSGYFGQSNGIPSKSYGDTIFCCAKITDTEGNVHYSDVIAYSVEAYASGRIANSSDAVLKELVKRMVIYGEYAKIYFS